MADPRSDRQAYLARVAQRLALPGAVTGEVLEELDAHIADSMASLREEGLAPDRVEREALARLGDPAELADGLRRARQTRRRLWSAVGYGAWSAVTGLAWGWVFGYVLFLVSGVAAAIIMIAVVDVSGTTTSGWDTSSAGLGAAVALFGVTYAGLRVANVIASRSFRPVAGLRGPVAAVGAIVVAIVAIGLYHGPLDGLTVAALVLAPAAFATGALLAGRVAADPSGRLRLRPRAVLAAVALSTAALVVISVTTLEHDHDGRTLITTQPIGGPIDPSLDVPYGGGGADGGGAATRELSFDRGLPAGWSDVRLEGWLGQRTWSDERGYLAPGQTAPMVTTPMLTDGDPTWWHADLRLPVTKQPQRYVVAVTALDGAGRRVVLLGPDAVDGPEWTGNAWTWLTAP